MTSAGSPHIFRTSSRVEPTRGLLGDGALDIAAEGATFALATSRGLVELEFEVLAGAAEAGTFASVGIDPIESKGHGKF